MNTTEISNSQDVIDSRDVIERIAELEGTEDEDELTELKALQALAEQCEGCGDWEYGESLINEDYFEDYARELAEDIGAIEKDSKWPATCIDWEQAANELKQDYMEVDFDGTTYYMRA